MLFQQPVADHLAVFGVAYHHRDNMAAIVHHRDANGVQFPTYRCDALLVTRSLHLAALQVFDARAGSRRNCWRKRGGKDET